MQRYVYFAALVVLSAALVSTTAAQQAATVTLRSGERVSGDLIDLGGVGFTLRVNGQERQIRQMDVSMIDFGTTAVTTPGEARTLPGGQSLLVLTNGDAVQGEFYDISGTTPLKITFRTPTGERTFDSTDVRRIYLTRAEGGAPTPAGAGRAGGSLTGGRTVQVLARNSWTPTNVTVRQGQVVRFETTGEVRITADVTASPAGNPNNLFDRTAPIPGVLQGALIGRLTNGRNVSAPFAIGNQTSVPMPSNGQLMLAVNDGTLNDNSGQFTVVILAQ